MPTINKFWDLTEFFGSGPTAKKTTICSAGHLQCRRTSSDWLSVPLADWCMSLEKQSEAKTNSPMDPKVELPKIQWCHHIFCPKIDLCRCSETVVKSLDMYEWGL